MGGVTPTGTSSGGPEGPHTKGCPRLSTGLSAQVPAVGTGCLPRGAPPSLRPARQGVNPHQLGQLKGVQGPASQACNPACSLGAGGTLGAEGGCRWGGGCGAGSCPQHWAVTQFPQELCGDGWAGLDPTLGCPSAPPSQAGPSPMAVGCLVGARHGAGAPLARQPPAQPPPIPLQATPQPPAMTSYRQELEKYRDIDEDKILQELSAEELEQLDMELLEMDPEVRPRPGPRWGGGHRAGPPHPRPPRCLPRTCCCRRGCGSGTRRRRARRGRWIARRCCSTWRNRRWRPASARTWCPSPARRKVRGWGDAGDGAPQRQVYLARRDGPRQRLGCPGRAGPPPAPGMAAPSNVTPSVATSQHRQRPGTTTTAPVPPLPQHIPPALPLPVPSPAPGHQAPIACGCCPPARARPCRVQPRVPPRRETVRAQEPQAGDPPRGADHAGARAGGGAGQRHRGRDV